MKFFQVFASMCLAAAVCGCQQDTVKQQASAMTGGNPDRGKAAIERYGCSSCHTIPGVRRANGLIGPSLEKIAKRNYVGGVLENTPENMMKWIENPPAISPETAMPNVHVTERDARDIASYLYTLQ